MKAQEANNIQCNPTTPSQTVLKVTVGEEPRLSHPRRTEAAPGAPGDAGVDSAGPRRGLGGATSRGSGRQVCRLHFLMNSRVWNAHSQPRDRAYHLRSRPVPSSQEHVNPCGAFHMPRNYIFKSQFTLIWKSKILQH